MGDKSKRGIHLTGIGDDGQTYDVIVDSSGSLRVAAVIDGVADMDIVLTASPGVNIGDVKAILATDGLFDGTTNLTPKFAIINAASGDTALVAAVSGKKLRVLSYQLVCGAASTVRFEDGAGGTALTGVMSFVDNGGISVNFTPLGHFETSANTALSLETTDDVDGHLTYVEV